MKNKGLWLVVVLLIVGGVYGFRAGWFEGMVEKMDLQKVGDNMEAEEIPGVEIKMSDSAEKVDLVAVNGMVGSGVGSRDIVEGVFMHTVVANLPEPSEGFYEGWLVREDPFEVVYTGKLMMEKGGWILEYGSNTDLSDHPLVVVTLEKVDDQKPEAHVLEGRF